MDNTYFTNSSRKMEKVKSALPCVWDLEREAENKLNKWKY